jgi:hypothetical protein
MRKDNAGQALPQLRLDRKTFSQYLYIEEEKGYVSP